jgi:hypothetical protein
MLQAASPMRRLVSRFISRKPLGVLRGASFLVRSGHTRKLHFIFQFWLVFNRFSLKLGPNIDP